MSGEAQSENEALDELLDHFEALVAEIGRLVKDPDDATERRDPVPHPNGPNGAH